MSQAKALDLFRQAMIAARAKDSNRARELLFEATTLDPSNETAWQWLADLATTPKEATLALERVLALNPNNDKAKTSIRPVRLKAGIEAAKAKDIPTAARFLRAAVTDDPNSEFGFLWLASVVESPIEAMGHLQRVLQINPNNAAAKKGIDYYQKKIAAMQPAQAPAMESPNFSSGPVGYPQSPGAPAPSMKIGGNPSLPAPSFKMGMSGTWGSRQIAPGSDDETSIFGGVIEPRAADQPSLPVNRSVLVVDPSRILRKLVGMTLSVERFRVMEATDAQEAADRLRENGTPDLIVVETALVGMNGYDFCEVIRQSDKLKNVPIIMLGTKDGNYDKLRGRVIGINAYLSKPLQPEVLLRTVRSLFRLPSYSAV